LAARDSLWVITLQTPALLCDPTGLTEASTASDLHKGYAEVWATLSGGTLAMRWYFTQESLAGGKYLHQHFMQHSGKPYRPYLLTDAGSVFVLTAVPGRGVSAAEKIRSWATQGLELPEWAVTAYSGDGRPGSHWSNCPYIPENGYGEIVVNLDIHWDKHPGEAYERIHSIQ
jgi:hypothetical protein